LEVCSVREDEIEFEFENDCRRRKFAVSPMIHAFQTFASLRLGVSSFLPALACPPRFQFPAFPLDLSSEASSFAKATKDTLAKEDVGIVPVDNGNRSVTILVT
jgi:hypothetical protein